MQLPRTGCPRGQRERSGFTDSRSEPSRRRLALLTHNGLLKSSVPSSDCSAFPCRPETREPMKGSTRGIPTARPCRVFGPLGPLRVSTLTPHEQQVVIQPPISKRVQLLTYS